MVHDKMASIYDEYRAEIAMYYIWNSAWDALFSK